MMFLILKIEVHFVLGVEVELLARGVIASQHLYSVYELDRGYLGDLRNVSFKYFQLVSVVLSDILHDEFQHSRFHRHNVVHTVDIAHLEIKSDVLVDVARGSVLFSSVNRCYLVNAVEYAYAGLLVELRRLVEERVFLEVVKTEDVRAALCALRNYLRRVYLGEIILLHEDVHTVHKTLLKLEYSALVRISQRSNAVIELGVDSAVESALRDLERHFALGGADKANV